MIARNVSNDYFIQGTAVHQKLLIMARVTAETVINPGRLADLSKTPSFPPLSFFFTMSNLRTLIIRIYGPRSEKVR